jgi:nucleoside-diphosphate-sugar epimerase
MALYLVTGGAGFIGSNLVEALLTRGEKVRVLDNFSTGKRENLAPFTGRIELIEGSVAHFEDCERAVAGVDYVLHEGALPSVPKSVAIPCESNEINVGGTAQHARRVAGREGEALRVRRVVLGLRRHADAPEDRVHDGRRPRARTRSRSTPVSSTAATSTRPTASRRWALRYFNIFGPRQDPTSYYSAVIPKFATAILEGRRPVIFGDGSQSRDFTFVENVVEANMLACTAPAVCAGRVMNIACGERISLSELVDVINHGLGTDVPPKFDPERAGDVKHSLADIALAKELIGYSPKVLFAEGIARTLKYYSAAAR